MIGGVVKKMSDREINYNVTHTYHIPREIAEKYYPNAQHHYSPWEDEFVIGCNCCIHRETCEGRQEEDIWSVPIWKPIP
jgi:hypothetical protein